jgi:hypothetical protein
LEKFENKNKILYHENALLKAENEVLKGEVVELGARLAGTSNYNNYPPSRDGYKKIPENRLKSKDSGQ